jgi:hypothetical protein
MPRRRSGRATSSDEVLERAALLCSPEEVPATEAVHSEMIAAPCRAVWQSGIPLQPFTRALRGSTPSRSLGLCVESVLQEPHRRFVVLLARGEVV